MDAFGNRRVPNTPPGRSQFNPYAAGRKFYGGGRSMPNIGPVSGFGKMGYAQRDNESKARKAAVLRRLKGQMSGNPMNVNVLLSNSGGGS